MTEKPNKYTSDEQKHDVHVALSSLQHVIEINNNKGQSSSAVEPAADEDDTTTQFDNEREDLESPPPAHPMTTDEDHSSSNNKDNPPQRQQDDEDRMMMKKKKSLLAFWRLIILCGFSFISSWANVVSLVHFGIFTSMVTGNLIFMGVGLSIRTSGGGADEHSYLSPLHPGYYAVAIVTNGMGALVAWYIISREDTIKENSSSCTPTTRCRWCCWKRNKTYQIAAFCFAMMVIGVVLYQVTHAVWGVLVFAPAFGAQQVYTMATKELGCSAIFMTGNLHKLSSTIANALLGKKRTSWTSNKAEVLQDLTPPFMLLFTLLGAIVGGLITNLDDRADYSRAMITPIQLLLFLMTEHLLISDVAK